MAECLAYYAGQGGAALGTRSGLKRESLADGIFGRGHVADPSCAGASSNVILPAWSLNHSTWITLAKLEEERPRTLAAAQFLKSTILGYPVAQYARMPGAS